MHKFILCDYKLQTLHPCLLQIRVLKLVIQGRKQLELLFHKTSEIPGTTPDVCQRSTLHWLKGKVPLMSKANSVFSTFKHQVSSQ